MVMQTIDSPRSTDSSTAATSTTALNWAQHVLIGGVKGYRLLLSPWLGASCRFWPTCSAYAITALEQHGAWRGSLLAVGRIARCQPWCRGGHDPVPAPGTGLFTALLRRESESESGTDPCDAQGERSPSSPLSLPNPATAAPTTDPVSRKLSA